MGTVGYYDRRGRATKTSRRQMDIKKTIEQIEHLMYGVNYEVCLGVDFFNVTTEDDFKTQLKAKYPDANPSGIPFTEVTYQEFYEDIQDKFNYRGDSGAGLTLTAKKELELKNLQNQFFDFINGEINKQSKFYFYPDPDGILGYPVF